MPDSTSSETFTRLLSWLAGIVIGGGGVLGWAKHKLDKARQPVELRLIETQAEVQHATAQKTVYDGLLAAAEGLAADAERLRGERNAERTRAETAEAEVERLLKEQKARHKMVNELTAFRIREELLEAGVPYEEVRRKAIEPIYPEAEGE